MRVAILLLFVAASVFAQDAAIELTKFERLELAYQKAVEEFYKPYREAKAKGEDYKLDWSKHPDPEYAKSFLAYAKAHPGTDDALRSLLQLLRMRRAQQPLQEALAILRRDHIESEGIKGAIYSLRYMGMGGGEAMLLAIVKRNPHREAQGPALLAIAQIEMGRDETKALALFKKVKQEYGDLPHYRGGTLAKAADAEMFEIQHLSVGKTAPEIEGEDIDGVPMKLSDYRGKVILLDFWGDW
ncbi:MAG: TlpA family protein disulfide reductase [Planctomycetota bacterium]|jgi:hypothetical protein